jgi:uncharacterized protein (DUF427 family)
LVRARRNLAVGGKDYHRLIIHKADTSSLFAIHHLLFTIMKAIWNNAVIAESNDTVVVEGNHYFPPESANQEHLQPSAKHTICPWKGEASYYDVVVDGEINGDAAWYYPDPKPAAAEIKDRIAFWRGVTVEE